VKVTVKLTVSPSAAVGTPAIRPAADRVRPAGSAPPVSDQVPRRPSATDSCSLYPVPEEAVTRSVTAMTGAGASTVTVTLRVTTLGT
jgi:hypothetical protein